MGKNIKLQGTLYTPAGVVNNNQSADLDDDGTEEVSLGGSEFEDPGGQGLPLVQGGRVHQLILLQISKTKIKCLQLMI